MWRIAFALFLLAHGAIHAAVWATPRTAGAPFDPARSWLFGAFGLGDGVTRPVSIALALVALVGLMGAGLGLFAHQDWWRAPAAAAAAVSLTLIALYFNAWLAGAVALDAAILAALLVAHWPAADLVGA